jgi:hypothetical protein
MGIILGAVLILALVFLLVIKRLQNFPNRTFVRAARKGTKSPSASGKTKASPGKPAPQNPNLLAANETGRQQGVPAETTTAPPVQQAVTPPKNAARSENTAPPLPAPVPQAPVARNTAKSSGGLLEKAGIIRNQAVSPAVPPVQQAATPPKNAPRPENTATPRPVPAPQASVARNAAKNTGSPVNYGAPRKHPAANSASYKKNPPTDNRPLLLSLFVKDQNTNIGRRNVHVLKPGYSLTLGGGKSDFLIFLVSLPPRIAELYYDGVQCTLIPRLPDFFPDLGSEPLPDCIEKPILLLSERNYELTIRIDRYEDPLTTLNRLLHSVDVPGQYWHA